MKLFYLFCFTFLILGSLSSCRKFEQEKILAEADPYKPTNLYPIERLPKYFNRVAVMPVYHKDPSSDNLSYSDEIFLKEISTVGLFEVVPVSTTFCKDTFGKDRISSSDSLPESFFKTLVERFGANGVLFIDLHSFKPYRPITLGVRSKLVDLKSGEFMWAVDEVLDSGESSIMVSANSFQRTNHVNAISPKTNNSIIQSPRLFTKFAASLIFDTLPNR